MRKCKRAVTDSDNHICYAPGKSGINNLMTIYACFTGKTMEQIEAEFSGCGYGTFKEAVGQACIDGLQPLQQTYYKLMQDKTYLEQVARAGQQRAEALAERTMRKVRKKVGFVQF